MHLLAFGLNHTTAPIAVRERAALVTENLEKQLSAREVPVEPSPAEPAEDEHVDMATELK